jgi:hypothetical protein
MSGDYSRRTFNPLKDYSGVHMQQGRVQLDADWNEQQQIDDRRSRVQTVDTMGRAVVPRSTVDGFRIQLPGDGRMLIHPGRMYVDGLLADNHGSQLRFDGALEEMAGTQPVEYGEQPYFPEAETVAPLPAGGPHLVYLRAWRRELTHLHEPDLVEKALGVDTTTRMQTAWQVRVLELSAAAVPTCTDQLDAWDTLSAPSAGRLTTDSVPADDDTNPCAIPISHGYRGLENRLYRVEVHKGGDLDSATFKWARDNASVETAVTHIDGTQITVVQSQWDQFRRFEIGNWVEISDDGREFSGHSGEMRRIEDINYDKNSITLSSGLPAGDFPTSGPDHTVDPERHTRVKRWDQTPELASGGVLTITGDPIVLELGVRIQFSLDAAMADGEFKTGDYWVFHARTVDGSVELLDAAPPHGIHYHYARLAVVTFPASLHDDCREFWPQQTDQSCCTVTVGDGVRSQGDVTSIADALALIPDEGGKICVLPGDYAENVSIDGRRNITIEGCRRRSVITSQPPAAAEIVARPVFRISNSTDIAIKTLKILAHGTGNGVLVEETPPDPDGPSPLPLEGITLDGLAIQAAMRSAIEVRAGKQLCISACDIQMEDVPTDWPAIFVAAEDCLIQHNRVAMPWDENAAAQIQINGRGGIQIGGSSAGVRIAHNHIHGGAGHGITLGSLELVDGEGMVVVGFIAVVARTVIDCDPCVGFDPLIPIGVVVNEEDPDNPLHYESAGPLQGIEIAHNTIHQMGMGGIGMAGFFQVDQVDDSILIEGLRIEHNRIHDCLVLQQVEIIEEQYNQLGHGAIALSVVEDLLVRHNIIEHNGVLHDDPVCGLFALHVEGAEVSHNTIVDNGARLPDPTEQARAGRRSGIHFIHVEAPLINIRYDDDDSQILRQNGTAAAKIHANTVVQPVGQALFTVARGPVQVSDNQLTSRGVMPVQNLATLAGTVFILNLGLPEELLNLLTTLAAVIKGGTAKGLGDWQTISHDHRPVGVTNPFAGLPLVNGNVQFSDNHCSLDLFGTETTFVANSILVLTLDDVAFQNNQCECSLDLLRDYDLILMPNFVLGLTVRLSGNRFEEGLLNALFSTFSWGLFMHTAVGNQATHCMWLRNAILPNRSRKSANVTLIDPNATGICKPFSDEG